MMLEIFIISRVPLQCQSCLSPKQTSPNLGRLLYYTVAASTTLRVRGADEKLTKIIL